MKIVKEPKRNPTILPSYPRVYAEYDVVVIENKPDERLFWGRESSVEKARQVAQELENELRIMEYIKNTIEKTIDEIKNAFPQHDSILIRELISEVLFQKARK